MLVITVLLASVLVISVLLASVLVITVLLASVLVISVLLASVMLFFGTILVLFRDVSLFTDNDSFCLGPMGSSGSSGEAVVIFTGPFSSTVSFSSR